MPATTPALTLADLPAPPPGKVGWPWTEATPPPTELPEKLPRCSIVTPSFNQGDYIEETIRTVLLQGYPDLEYAIIDGGSTDATVEIIRKYEPFLASWVSEPDAGQSDAIAKGFARTTGDVMGWLNSDDLFAPGALWAVARRYAPGPRWWTGRAGNVAADGTAIAAAPESQTARWLRVEAAHLLHARRIIAQSSTFWTRELWEAAGSTVSEIHYAMDFELWLRFARLVPSEGIPIELSRFRSHAAAKTSTAAGGDRYARECDAIRSREYERRGTPAWQRYLLAQYWTRRRSAASGQWRSWLGRRQVPYV